MCYNLLFSYLCILTTKKTTSTLVVKGYRVLDNALVIDYSNDKGEWKKTYSFNCPATNSAKFGALLIERLEIGNSEYVMNEAKKLCEKGLLINVKELKDNLEDEMESLIE